MISLLGASCPSRGGRWVIFRAALSALAFLLCLGLKPHLLSYETLGFSWPNGRAHFRVNPNFPDTALAGTRDQQVELFRCAARAWRDQTRANFEFIYDGTTSRVGVSSDGVNAISWVNAEDAEGLAATFIENTGTRIVGFDIVFFARTGGDTNLWSGQGEPEIGTLDITGVAVHELGHGLGMDHEPDLIAATMFPTVVSRGLPLRTLHSDDVAGVQSIYGTRTTQPPGVQILSVTPDFGPTGGGNEVVLEGVNFTYDSETQLRLGGLTVSTSRWDVESCARLRIFNMPPHSAGAVDILVSNSIGSVTLPGAYRYGGPAPTLTAIEPPSGPLTGGIPVTVRGENLTPDAEVTIGGRPLENPVFVDAQTITGTLPSSPTAGAVDIELRQGVEVVSLASAFTYNPYHLRIDDATAVPGQLGLVVNTLATTADPLSSISFGFTYEPAVATVRRITTQGTATAGAEFAAADIDNAGGVATFGIVMSFAEHVPFVPPGEDVLVARIVCDIAPDASPGESTPLQLGNLLGQPPIELIFTRVGDSTPLRPLVADGSITIVEGQTFVRGNVNGDATIDLSDATYGLNNLFLGGPPPIPCDDPADINDDGRRDLSDAIFLLNFLFLGGPQPQPPHPLPGVDPTADMLDC